MRILLLLRFLIVTVCFTLAIPILSLSAHAADNGPKLPAPLQTLLDDGAQIRYIGHELGTDGWIAIKNGQEQYFYQTADGQALISGILFNSKGDAITLRQINDLRKKEGPAIDKLAGMAATTPATPSSSLPAPTSPTNDAPNTRNMMQAASKSKAEQLFAGVERANWVSVGSDKAPAIYMFMDPECPHCHDVLQDYRGSGFLEKGLVQLRLIPVGVLSANSLKEAAYLLASPAPQTDLYKHLDGKKDALLVDQNANTQGVERNMKLMQDWNLDVIPFSVYKDRTGKVKILQGRPKNLKEIITELR